MARFENGKMKINTQDVRVYTTLFFTHLAYRECCYSCKYADIQREGDITLGDFLGGVRMLCRLFLQDGK